MRTELIAEVGLSHEGSLGNAFALVDAAKSCGADTVKFQYHNPEWESTNLENFRVSVFPQDLNRFDYWKRTSFQLSEWKKLKEYCDSLSIGFLCTPFSVNAAIELNSIGVARWKIGSGDLSNPELLENLITTRKPIILSTGMSTSTEVLDRVQFMRSMNFEEFSLAYCLSEYPTLATHLDYSKIGEYSDKFGCPVGLSDHSGSLVALTYALSKEPAFIEFHFVLSKLQFGPDTSSSIDTDDLEFLVKMRDFIESNGENYFDKDLFVAQELGNMRETFGRGLALKSKMYKGDLLSMDDFCLRKPKGPLDWHNRYDFVGKRLRRDVSAYEHLSSHDVD
jgi:N,N'-diacetyllegionaminate synthase